MERFPRIEALRRMVLENPCPGVRSEEGSLLYLRAWLQNQQASSKIVRRALAKAAMLAGSTPVIWPGELVVGKPCYRPLTPEEAEELALYNRYSVPAMDPHFGQDAHMAIDYEKLLRLGLDGIAAQIERYRAALDPLRPEDLEKDEFYRACLLSLDGVRQYAGRYAAYARAQAAAEPDPVRRAELEAIADNLAVVPAKPAGGFRQAVQSIHFVTVCLEGLYQLGRPDRYLYPYYLADRAAGVLTDRDALEWLDCLCLKYNEYIPKSLAAGFMICGRDKDGRDVTNELSRLFLETIDHVRLSYPGVSVCWNEDTPPDILRRACELLGCGYSHPPIFNDDVILRGLRSYGVPADEACAYVQSTCVEITVCNSSTVWVASPYINLTAPLLDILGAGQDRQACSFDEFVQHDGCPPTQAATFEAFKAAYKDRLRLYLRNAVIEQNRGQMERQKNHGDPLVSCFVNDCLRLGRDQDWGGGRYKFIMPSFVGLANLVDSFLTVDRLVYRDQRYSLSALRDILLQNFAGQESLRQEILMRIPKYGNDNDEADALCREMSEWISEECARYSTWFGARYIPSLFCWVMHDRLGCQTGATPDGRTAGFPLGDGSGPAQGRERCGPTASALSSTKWDHHRFIGGIAVNFKFGKSMCTPATLPKMQTLIETFLRRGGFEIQVNVVDRATLLAAQAHPEQYQDLVVRIGGYSDYFVNLTPSMQQEVLARTEHEL